jgi:hypothetical protein
VSDRDRGGKARASALSDIQGFAARRGKLVSRIGQAAFDCEWKKPAAYFFHF